MASEEGQLPRKLAAILYADVAGYSRLTGEDEEGTHRKLSAYLDLLSNAITAHNGTVVHYAGDALLAEFLTVTEAISCAAYAQQALGAKNKSLLDEDKLQFRIGVNLGEVIVDREDIYGDGVNVAARLESLAEPGGVCVSESVRGAVGDRLPVDFEDIGEQQVKNISKPVRAYHARLRPGVELPAPSRRRKAKSGKWRLFAKVAAAVLVAVAGALIWRQAWKPQEEPASMAQMAFPLPDKPSIAVLPFTNMSGDPAQEYFADGISEDLITDLARISGLFVIARNSSFSYKGQSVKMRQVAEELGVRYVLEGSVRRGSDKVRINIQLLDATTGGHLWANRFDRNLDDIFKVQDEVVAEVVSALVVELTEKEKISRETRDNTGNLQAHEYFLRGRQHRERSTREDTAEAKEFFEKAIELDPDHVRALTALGRLHYDEWNIWGAERDQNLSRALEMGQKAVAVDDTLVGPHVLLSQIYRFLLQKEQSEIETEKALALEPREADTLAGLADVLRFSGGAEQAVELLRKAMRLDPFYPAWYESYLGQALFNSGRYEEAITALKRGAERNSYYPAFPLYIAASYAMLGREMEAREAAAEVLRINPRFSISAFAAHVPFKSKEYLEHEMSAFRQAGIPE